MSDVKPLKLILKDKQALYQAYMPFLKRGGLFVPTNRSYRPGQVLHVAVLLPEQPDPVLISGELVWHTPVGAQGRKTPGIGIHLSEEDTPTRKYIEEQLAGMLNSDQATHTI